MKRISALVGAFSVLVSTCAFAQATGGNTKPADHGAQKVQPGSDSKEMGRAADAGTPGPASGTLMQRRENAMSPQGASGGSGTGKVRQ